MPDQTGIKLNDILREERKSKLVPLEKDFYYKVGRQIQELEEEKREISDKYGTKYEIIEDELKTARKVIDNIIERRTKKIITEASLRASSKQKEKQDLESMTMEERIFYNRLLEVMAGWRGEISEKILGKTKDIPLKEEAPMEKKITEAPDEIKSTPEIKGDTEGKKDISKEYIVVRLLKDIPTFVGVDGRNYTLAKEDIAVLSAVNAKALINRKAAVQIPVKR
jgi:DNA replication factor GINS